MKYKIADPVKIRMKFGCGIIVVLRLMRSTKLYLRQFFFIPIIQKHGRKMKFCSENCRNLRHTCTIFRENLLDFKISECIYLGVKITKTKHAEEHDLFILNKIAKNQFW